MCNVRADEQNSHTYQIIVKLILQPSINADKKRKPRDMLTKQCLSGLHLQAEIIAETSLLDIGLYENLR